MEIKGLPIKYDDINKIKENKLEIDMSILNFNCENEMKKRAAFVLLRNFYIKDGLNFSKCTYEEKCEYLLLYLQGDIILDLPQLNNTWFDIIYFYEGYNHLFDNTILNEEEIKKFIEEYKEYLLNIASLIVSLPYLAMKYYIENANNITNADMNNININEYETCDFYNLNIKNFVNIIQLPSFLYLINPSETIKPKYFTNIFSVDETFNDLLKYLPFLDFMNLLFNSKYEKNADVFLNKLFNLL